MTHIPAMIFLFAFSQPDSLENQLLSLYPQAFREDATTLSIATANGDTVAFRNRYDSPDGLRSTLYSLMDYLPAENLWTVKTLGYEWIGWQVVDGVTGSTTATIGPPVPSPDGTRLLCMNEDIHAGYTQTEYRFGELNRTVPFSWSSKTPAYPGAPGTGNG